MNKISVVINTLNEEANIARAINSVKWADEILVCDMYSDDDTAVIAKKLGAKIIFHKRVGYVEPARNFAISKAAGEWILILDADEEIPETLAQGLKEMVDKPIVSTYVEIPRKNIIFGKWMRASMWWPDYHVRFFKKGSVIWNNKIHSKPTVEGQGLTLPAEERWAITHHNYNNVDQIVERHLRYTTIQAKELRDDGVKVGWRDLISKPLGEFLGRFFANRGYEDGMHGLALSMLQAFFNLMVYLKLWQMQNFEEAGLKLEEIGEETTKAGSKINYWLRHSSLSKNPVKRLLQKIKGRI